MKSSFTIISISLCFFIVSCGFSGRWKTTSNVDEVEKTKIYSAERDFSADGFLIKSRVSCIDSNRLIFTFSTFREGGKDSGEAVADFKDQSRWSQSYRWRVDGGDAEYGYGPLRFSNVIDIEDEKLYSSKLIMFKLLLDSGSPNIAVDTSETGISDVIKSCQKSEKVAKDSDPPVKEVQKNTSEKLYSKGDNVAENLPTLLDMKYITPQTLAGHWKCSGDLGSFAIDIVGGMYRFSGSAPKPFQAGVVTVGAGTGIGSDDGPSFPVRFEGFVPAKGWDYSPLGPGGAISWFVEETGDSEQCSRGL